MVVYDLYYHRPNISPHKADAPLIIDLNAVLALPVILQRLQMITGRCLQEGQRLRSFELRKLSLGYLRKGFEPARTLT